MTKIMIMSGEASGDLHGANLAAEIRNQDPGAVIYGVGSRRMKEAGVRMLADASEISVVGLTEVLLHIGKIAGVMQRLKKFLRDERPDLLILIDFPDFNIHLGRTAKKLGVPVLYYISPQVWAWRKGRIKQIAELVKAMIVVFPFEVDLYKRVGVDVRYAGHPLTDIVKSTYTRTDARKSLGLDPEARTITLLPGSRKKEITSLLPDMLRAAGLLKERFHDLQFVLPVAPTLDQHFVRTFADQSHVPMRIVDGKVYDALRASDAAIVASGTATLETGLMGVPMVIVYRVSRISYAIGRLLIDAPNVGLVNIIAGKRIVPEFIQGEVTPQNMADAVTKMLSDHVYYREVADNLAGIRVQLGDGGASARAASVVMEMLKNTA